MAGLKGTVKQLLLCDGVSLSIHAAAAAGHHPVAAA